MRNALLAIGRLISSRPISSFLLVTYAWSWLVWIPSVLLYRRTGGFSLPALIIGAYGPTVAALIVTAVVDGHRGTSALLRRYVAWRVGVRWYVAALCGLWIPALALAEISFFAAEASGRSTSIDSPACHLWSRGPFRMVRWLRSWVGEGTSFRVSLQARASCEQPSWLVWCGRSGMRRCSGRRRVHSSVERP